MITRRWLISAGTLTAGMVAEIGTGITTAGTAVAGIGTSTQAEEIETNNTVNTRAMTPGHMSLPVEREMRMRLTGPGIPAIVYRGGRIEKEALTATGTAAAVTSGWGTVCVGSIFQKRVVVQAVSSFI